MKLRKRKPPEPVRQPAQRARAKPSRRKTVRPAPAPASRGKAAKRRLKAKPPALPFAIPPLLLEGDASPPLERGGPGERFAIGHVPSASAIETAPMPAAAAERLLSPAQERPESIVAAGLILQPCAPESKLAPELPSAALPPVEAVAAPQPLAALPAAYGTGRLVMVARDPRCLYAQWDLSDEQLRACESRAAAGRLVLNVWPEGPRAEPHHRIELPPGARACFVAVERAGAGWIAELGYRNAAGQWQSVAESEPVATPRETLVTEGVPRFVTLAVEVPPPATSEPAAPVVTAPPVVSEIPLEAPPQGGPPPGQVAVPAQLEAIVREQLAAGASSVALAQPPPWALIWPGGTPVGVSSLAGAPGGPETPAPRRGFWFNLGVELVVYGATEPDAKVTVGGRLIKLRPDGTFSLRLALPDGEYELPLVAISATDDDGRSAMLQFGRHTDYWGAANAPDCA